MYSGRAPLAETIVPVVDPISDTTRDPVVVVDGVPVSEEVDVAVVVAETVGAEPVDAGVAMVAFAEIGAAAVIDDRAADACERADDAADGITC